MNMFKNLLANFRYFSTKPNVHQTEAFNELAEMWWNDKGILRILHTLNDLRVNWITTQLIKTGTIQKTVDKSTTLKGISVLDVGCGGGILTEPLSRLGGDITGLDCNVEMIKIATSRMQDKNVPNLRYILSAIEEYSTDNKNKYDVVVASETIEHVNEQDVFLKCCVECLKPGGSIFITTNSKSQCSKFLFITLLEDILSALPKGTHEYDMFIDIEEAKNLLRKEKCDVTFSSGIIYSPFNNRWYWIKNPYILHYGLHAIKSS